MLRAVVRRAPPTPRARDRQAQRRHDPRRPPTAEGEGEGERARHRARVAPRLLERKSYGAELPPARETERHVASTPRGIYRKRAPRSSGKRAQRRPPRRRKGGVSNPRLRLHRKMLRTHAPESRARGGSPARPEMRMEHLWCNLLLSVCLRNRDNCIKQPT